MWERINKYFYFICFLISDAWFWNDFYAGEKPWEQTILILSSLGMVVYEEVKDIRRGEKSDIALLNKFLEALPYEGSISFINSANMAGPPFDPEKHNDLRTFYYHWDDASHEFLDKNIEKRKEVLWDLTEKYIMALGTDTVSTGDGLQTVPPEWKTEQPEHFKEAVDSFHSLAGEIVNAHQEIIRYAKKKLRI